MKGDLGLILDHIYLCYKSESETHGHKRYGDKETEKEWSVH